MGTSISVVGSEEGAEENMNLGEGGREFELRWVGQKRRGFWTCLIFGCIEGYGVDISALDSGALDR